MTSAVRFVAGWFVAGVIAVLAAGQGVSIVAARVTTDRSAPLTTAEVRESLGRDAPSAEVSAGAVATAVAPTTVPPASTTTEGARSSSTPTTRPAGPASPGGSDVKSETSTSSDAQTPSTTVPAAPQDRTYALRGGTLTLRFSASGVVVVIAQPANGYSYSVETQHGNGLRVEFRKEHGRSRVDAWWEDGPHDQVSEN